MVRKNSLGTINMHMNDAEIYRLFIQYFKVTKTSGTSGIAKLRDGLLDVDGEVSSNHSKESDQLESFPIKFGSVNEFRWSGWNLKSLKNSPNTVINTFNVNGNLISTMIGGPSHVGEIYSIMNNPLENLDGLPDYCGDFCLSYDAKLPMLRLLKYEQLGIYEKDNDYHPINKIFEKYVGKDLPMKKKILNCQHDLIKDGFVECARL